MLKRITSYGKEKAVGYKNMWVRAGTELSGFKRVKQLFQTVDNDLGTMVVKHREMVIKNDRFDETVAKFKLTEKDLEVRYKEFRWLARIYFVFVLLSLGLGLYFEGVLPLMTGIGVSMIPLSLWFRWSFRAWQIRIRDFGEPKEFIKQPLWWAEAFK